MFKCLRCIYLESSHRKFFLAGLEALRHEHENILSKSSKRNRSKTLTSCWEAYHLKDNFRIWNVNRRHMSDEKNLMTFHYTGCLIRIQIMMYYNPYITGQYNPLYTLNNQCFFIAHNDFFSGLPYFHAWSLLKVTCVHANFMQFVEEDSQVHPIYSNLSLMGTLRIRSTPPEDPRFVLMVEKFGGNPCS